MEVRIKIPSWTEVKNRIRKAMPSWGSHKGTIKGPGKLKLKPKMPKAPGSWGRRFNRGLAIAWGLITLPLMISSLLIGSVFFIIFLAAGLYMAAYLYRKSGGS